MSEPTDTRPDGNSHHPGATAWSGTAEEIYTMPPPQRTEMLRARWRKRGSLPCPSYAED